MTACILVACQVAPTTTAITVNGAKQVYTGEFDLADYSIVVATSDGNMRTEPLTAQNLANVTVEQLQKAGVYNISVVYDGVTTAFTLTVASRTFEGITFADKTVTYNGTAQSIEVANLPQGATVTYSPSNKVTRIDSNAFYECIGLTRIDFNGTKAQWKAIEKDSYWCNYTGDFTVYCTDGTISKLEA